MPWLPSVPYESVKDYQVFYLMRCIMFRFAAVLAIILPSASAASDPLQPLNIRQVKVAGEIGRRIDVTIHNNLLVLDKDKDFLAPFEKKAQKSGYIGLGKLLMSAVRFAAYSNDPQAVALKDHLVRRILATQESDGYIGYFTASSRMTALWDVHEMGYLVAGLTDDYRLFQNRAALDGAVKAADYMIAHWKEIPQDWGTKTGVATHVAVTGLERTMLHLSAATGDKKYTEFVTGPRKLAEWDLPVVVGRKPGIEGHMYAYMARSLAQLELFRQRPEPRLLGQANRGVDFLTRHDGMAVTGGAGQWEIWTDDQDGRGQLAETCATAYQLRVLDNLLRLRAEARMGDLMERTIYNTLFAAQSPDGRRIRYYSPLEGPREYHPGDTYCCPCNYRRIVSELPEMIYYRTARGVAVNLYTASEATLETAGASLRVKQQTDYPTGGVVTLHLDPARATAFDLLLRIPAWAKGTKIAVNGQPSTTPAVAGTFAKLTREWKPGDQVRVEFPMDFRLVRGRQRQSGRVAVLRGPLVFSLNPSIDAAMAKLDSADLGRYALDRGSLEFTADDSVRPGGVACRAGAWKPGYSTQAKHELQLRLTEFADPNARATYFRVRDLSVAVDDELLAPARPALAAVSRSTTQ